MWGSIIKKTLRGLSNWITLMETRTWRGEPSWNLTFIKFSDKYKSHQLNDNYWSFEFGVSTRPCPRRVRTRPHRRPWRSPFRQSRRLPRGSSPELRSCPASARIGSAACSCDVGIAVCILIRCSVCWVEKWCVWSANGTLYWFLRSVFEFVVKSCRVVSAQGVLLGGLVFLLFGLDWKCLDIFCGLWMLRRIRALLTPFVVCSICWLLIWFMLYVGETVLDLE